MIGRTVSGVAYLRPRGALLDKAARPRPKDEADFHVAAAELTSPERAWLTEALGRRIWAIRGIRKLTRI
jgi:hypothetical protein